jgi:hypothetical protein
MMYFWVFFLCVLWCFCVFLGKYMDCICSHMIKPCDIQEQLFVAQFVLHPQLMSSINHSMPHMQAAGPSSQRTTYFFSITHPCFSADGRPNIDRQARFQTAA